MKSRRQATLDVLVVMQDALDLNTDALPDAARTFEVSGFAQGTFEHEGWEMTMKLTARRKKGTDQEGGAL